MLLTGAEPSPALSQLQTGLSTFLPCLGLGAAGAELWEPRGGGEGHSATLTTALTRPQGLRGSSTALQGLDIPTNQQRNSLQLCTMRGNPAGGMYMSVDWHGGHHSCRASAHGDHAAKPWALPGWVFSAGSPGTEGQKGKAAVGGGHLDMCGPNRGGQQVKYLSCCLF